MRERGLSLVASTPANVVRPDAFAIPQNRYAVGELKDFFQAMRNVDDAHPAGAQFAHDTEKQMLLLLRQ